MGTIPANKVCSTRLFCTADRQQAVRLHTVNNNDTATKTETRTLSTSTSSVVEWIPSSAMEGMGIVATGGEGGLSLGHRRERGGGCGSGAVGGYVIVRTRQKCESEIIEKCTRAPNTRKKLANTGLLCRICESRCQHGSGMGSPSDGLTNQGIHGNTDRLYIHLAKNIWGWIPRPVLGWATSWQKM